MRKKIYNNSTRVHFCKVYITSTKNNTFATIHAVQNDTRYHFSCGRLGIKGSKKKTGYATHQVIRTLIKRLKEENTQQVILYVAGYKRKLSTALGILLVYFTKNNVRLLRIQNVQPIMYNGTRPSKMRRV